MNVYSYNTAIRHHGVCQGTLWRQLESNPSSSTGAVDTRQTCDYCVLTGVRLRCFESFGAFQRGDVCQQSILIVGASSAWKPAPASATASNASSTSILLGLSTSSSTDTSFRLVSDQGTHYFCQAPTTRCRDLWLSTLYASLEQVLRDDVNDHNQKNDKQQPASRQRRVLLPLPEAQKSLKARTFSRHRFCASCGAFESPNKPLSGAIPLSQYGKEHKCDVCNDCLTAQGLLDHLEFVKDLLASASQERQALEGALNLVRTAIQPLISEGGAGACGESSGDGTSRDDGSSAGSWTHVDSDRSSTPSPPEPSKDMSGSWQSVENSSDQGKQRWVHLPPTEASTTALLEMLRSSDFASLARLSPLLDRLSSEVLNGHIDVTDFLEHLEEAAGQRESHQSRLKKQAFRLAGDMGSAMKLLADHALGPKGDLDMLTCILDFFLDLCENDNELSSIAFFWPQLCHIHLRMLPPKNFYDLARIDLMEDFLITIAARHSIHLALELVWSHTADLEDSLLYTSSGGSGGGSSSVCLPACRRRRFAVLRFVCELESVLFDFDGAWGGGSVSLGKMLLPTGHQVGLLKSTMHRIQELRKASPNRLARSFLLETLQISRFDWPPEEAVKEKLRIAKNADYFSSHLNFTHRLCDTAEKLRFMEVEQRAKALERELELLNASGAMGGDPLNRLRDDLIRVVRVPSAEGHVFRSKERTPVLLLMEVVNESAEGEVVREQVRKGSESLDNSGRVETATAESTNLEQLSRPDTMKVLTAGTGEPAETQLAYPCPPSPSCRPRLQSAGGTWLELEGSSDEKPSPRPTGLKRFDAVSRDSNESPATPKRAVELLVNSAMEHRQLQEMILPDLDSSYTRRPPDLDEGDEDLKEIDDHSKHLDECKKGDECSRSNSDGKADETPRKLTVSPVPSGKQASTSPSEQQRSLSPVSGEQQLSISPMPSDRGTRKKAALASLSCSPGDGQDSNVLAPTGDVRREVLTTIMMRGRQGKDAIAAGAADSFQRSLKELERQRATELLLTGSLTEAHNEDSNTRASYTELESTREKLVSLGIGSISPNNSAGEEARKVPTEEDEVMEAIRLLLIQNRVAQGYLSEDDAALVLQHTSLSGRNASSDVSVGRKGSRSLDPSEMPTIDAGDVDPRLVGCGPLPPAILQALTLWKAEMVSNAELLELVKKDLEFLRYSVLHEAENSEKLHEDSAFWGRFAFGERWAEKKSRIAATSPQGSHPGWDLVGVIVKSNDDLRQESFVMQLIELCQEAFELAGLELWVNPYRVLATGRTTGVIQMVRNAMSFDALKKRPGYGKGGLREHLHRMTEFTADPGGAFKSAQQNFVRSLAAYSLLSYLFMFKDRHNGNLLLDTAGHVIHIDFGFVFGIAPGGSFSLEMSTPFKLTDEMLDVMGGLKSPLFSEFVTLFCCGFLALQPYSGTFVTIVEIMCKDSTFKCFDGRDTDEVVSKLRERFAPDLSKEETVSFALDLIRQAVTSYGTRQYDMFQYLSQGIAT